jgi:hypothetical protein
VLGFTARESTRDSFSIRTASDKNGDAPPGGDDRPGYRPGAVSRTSR